MTATTKKSFLALPELTELPAHMIADALAHVCYCQKCGYFSRRSVASGVRLCREHPDDTAFSMVFAEYPARGAKPTGKEYRA